MKKLLALVLALVMVFSVTAVASAGTVKLEKHPYEKPNRELPYEAYQTVPKAIATPAYEVATDFDAVMNEDGTVKNGVIKVTFKTSDSATVAELVKNMKFYNVDENGVASEKEILDGVKTKVTADAKGNRVLQLELNPGEFAWIYNHNGFALKSNADIMKLNDSGVLVKDGEIDYQVNFKWDPKTDKAEVAGYTISSTVPDYSTNAVKCETVEYYPNGKVASLTITHVDGDHVAGTVVGGSSDKPEYIEEDEENHDYTDNNHTDHRYSTVTFNYDEETGKLVDYYYETEVSPNGKQPITPDKFNVTASGEVIKAEVNVNGVVYTYKTVDWWVSQGTKASDVKPGQIGWFIGNVAVAAPEGYENGFANTVHLFAKRHWYPENTVGVVGLSLRDEYPGLTDKWINIVPVDLTIQGTQEIELLAGNMFHIGKAFVDVDGDNVTVTYSYTNNVTEAFSECVKWFKNIDEITTEFCENPTSDLVFGQPVSIANDLGGQEVALLYICNSATYYQTFITTQDAPNRYYKNLKKWQNYRAGLYELLDKIPE